MISLLQRQQAAQYCQSSRQHIRRARTLPIARFVHDPTAMPGKERFPIEEGLPLSLFHPFKRLPADGTTVPAEEEMCDPEEERCYTALHVYEARCTVCSGTGWARAPSNGRRGHLGTCILCHGLGYVRRTTSRFCPDDPDKHMTIARPLSWNGKYAARFRPIDVHLNNSSNGNGSSNGSNGSSGGGGSSQPKGSRWSRQAPLSAGGWPPVIPLA